MPLPEVTERLVRAYHDAGYQTEIIESTPRMARLMVSGPGVECEVDLLKEAIGPPARLRVGPVLAFDDAVGLKVRALHERAVHRDYIDVHAASKVVPEALGARHTPGFSLAELADRLGNIGELVGDGFERYGLDTDQVGELARWAVAWESDIRLRLAAGEEDPPGGPEDDLDAYIDQPG